MSLGLLWGSVGSQEATRGLLGVVGGAIWGYWTSLEITRELLGVVGGGIGGEWRSLEVREEIIEKDGLFGDTRGSATENVLYFKCHRKNYNGKAT